VDDTLWALLIRIRIGPLACGALALATLLLDLRGLRAPSWQEDLALPALSLLIVYGGLPVALTLTADADRWR
jgi:hypothetical protein